MTDVYKTDPDNQFRNTNNVLMYRALFFETSAEKARVLYTLKDHDHKGYPSLYRLYLEKGDPTEYLFATEYLESWEHWLALCEANWFKPYVYRWRKELELKQKAEALATIIRSSKGAGRDAQQAAKYVAEGKWQAGPSRGRPSKEEVSRRAHELAEDQVRLDEDFDRISGLN